MGHKTNTGHEPIAPRILAILADKQWHTRAQLAIGLNRFSGLPPNDIRGLERMITADQIEFRWTPTRGASGRWEYRITQGGLDELAELTKGDQS